MGDVGERGEGYEGGGARGVVGRGLGEMEGRPTMEEVVGMMEGIVGVGEGEII